MKIIITKLALVSLLLGSGFGSGTAWAHPEIDVEFGTGKFRARCDEPITVAFNDHGVLIGHQRHFFVQVI